MTNNELSITSLVIKLLERYVPGLIAFAELRLGSYWYSFPYFLDLIRGQFVLGIYFITFLFPIYVRRSLRRNLISWQFRLGLVSLFCYFAKDMLEIFCFFLITIMSKVRQPVHGGNYIQNLPKGTSKTSQREKNTKHIGTYCQFIFFSRHGNIFGLKKKLPSWLRKGNQRMEETYSEIS